MYRKYGQIFAPAISALPPSMVVVLGQCMEQLPNGYALITGVLPVTLRARFAHVKLFLQFYRRIVQTTATDGGSVDFASLHGKDCSYNPIAFPPSMQVRCNLVGQCRSNCRGASHRPDSLTDLIKYLSIVCIPMKYPG